MQGLPEAASRPARGAWVEIQFLPAYPTSNVPSRPARGAWVEMWEVKMTGTFVNGRAPQGARGLKSRRLADRTHGAMSRPARGAWVEMETSSKAETLAGVAPRKGRVG